MLQRLVGAHSGRLARSLGFKYLCVGRKIEAPFLALVVSFSHPGGAESSRWQTIAPSGKRKHQSGLWQMGQGFSRVTS